MIGEDVSFKVAAMQGRLNRLNEGAGSATIECYGTVRPAKGGPAGAGALAIISLADPAGIIDEEVGTLTLVQTADALILSTGIVLWCRVKNGAGVFCFDIDAAEQGSPEESSAEAIFSTTQLYAGGGLRLVSCVLG